MAHKALAADLVRLGLEPLLGKAKMANSPGADSKKEAAKETKRWLRGAQGLLRCTRA